MFTDNNLGGHSSRFLSKPKIARAALPWFKTRKQAKRTRASWVKRLHVGPRPAVIKPRLTRLVNYRGGLALAEYEFDGGLGKFKIKKVFKKVVKTAGKIAAAPTAAGLQAVGLKKVSGKLGKAVGYTKGEMNAIRSAGKGIQYAAAATGAVMLAPAAGAAFSAVGKGAMVAGKAVGGKLLAGGKLVGGKLAVGGKLLKKGVGLFGGLLKKAPKTVEEAQEMAQEAQQAAQNAGLVQASVPEEQPAPQSPFAPSSAGGGGAAPGSAEGAEGSAVGASPESGVTEAGLAGFPGKIPPVMLIAAVAAVALALPKMAKARR